MRVLRMCLCVCVLGGVCVCVGVFCGWVCVCFQVSVWIHTCQITLAIRDRILSYVGLTLTQFQTERRRTKIYSLPSPLFYLHHSLTLFLSSSSTINKEMERAHRLPKGGRMPQQWSPSFVNGCIEFPWRPVCHIEGHLQYPLPPSLPPSFSLSLPSLPPSLSLILKVWLG